VSLECLARLRVCLSSTSSPSSSSSLYRLREARDDGAASSRFRLVDEEGAGLVGVVGGFVVVEVDAAAAARVLPVPMLAVVDLVNVGAGGSVLIVIVGACEFARDGSVLGGVFVGGSVAAARDAAVGTTSLVGSVLGDECRRIIDASTR